MVLSIIEAPTVLKQSVPQELCNRIQGMLSEGANTLADGRMESFSEGVTCEGI